jgi:hypothetical protein
MDILMDIFYWKFSERFREDKLKIKVTKGVTFPLRNNDETCDFENILTKVHI